MMETERNKSVIINQPSSFQQFLFHKHATDVTKTVTDRYIL